MGQSLGKTMIEEAYEEQARVYLLLLGRQRFGEPTPEIETILIGIDDLKRLDRMAARLLTVSSWTELLETL